MKKYFLFSICILLAVILTVCFFNGGGSKQTKVNQNKVDVAKIKEVSITDCGISKVDTKAYEKDKTLVCLGKSMLSGCRNSKAILDMAELGQVNVEVKKNGEKCVGIMKFGNKEQIKDTRYEKFANKDIQCSLDKLFDEQYRVSTTGLEFSETPGWLAAAFYYHMIMQPFMIMQPIVYPETECTGTFFDAYSDFHIPVGMPTQEETLSYAAKAIEDGAIEEALKMFYKGAHNKIINLLNQLDLIARKNLAQSLTVATLDQNSTTPNSDTFKTYTTQVQVEGHDPITTRFHMITLPNGNWVILDL